MYFSFTGNFGMICVFSLLQSARVLVKKPQAMMTEGIVQMGDLVFAQAFYIHVIGIYVPGFKCMIYYW